ncbi:hypothetical protein [Halovivax sp.]|nr:hypothetical protein [Halovivax sp.]
MTPPVEPLLAFAAVASTVYVLAWRLWWDVLADEGVVLRYSDDY